MDIIFMLYIFNIFTVFWRSNREELSMSVSRREFYPRLLKSTWKANMQDGYWGNEVSACKFKIYKEKNTEGLISY